MDDPIGVAINADKALSTQSGGSHRSEHQLDAMAFKHQLELCHSFFRRLIEAMVHVTKESAFAKPYFHPVIRRLDSDLVRIEIWAFDLGANEKDFGSLTQDGNPDLELTRFITTILKDLQSDLKDSERQVEKMRSLIQKMSGRRSNDLKLDRQLQVLVAKFEEEYQKVTLAIRSLINLTEAFQMELATKLKSGPYAKFRQRHMEAIRQDLRLPPPSHTATPRRPSVSSIDLLPLEIQDAWSRKTLLSFDIGGTQSISSLIILQALMVEIAAQEQTTEPRAYSSASPLDLQPRAVQQTKEEQQQQLKSKETVEHTGNQDSEISRYLPCHYFDYTIGTFFGGLIAIMLSCLRMNVEETLNEFQTLLDSAWTQERSLGSLTSSYMYDYKVLERGIKDMVSRKVSDADADTMFEQHNDDTSRCIVVAENYSKKLQGPSLFCSYHHPTAPTTVLKEELARNEAEPKPCTIWQVARAATAIPAYFAPIKLGEGIEAEKYFSGDSTPFNPSGIGYVSAKEASGSDPALVMSIGSGCRDSVREILKDSDLSIRPFSKLNARLYKIRTIHLQMEALTSTQELSYYSRLSVPEGSIHMREDQWEGKHGEKTLNFIRELTESYLNQVEVKKRITETARRLVQTRRARAKTDHWEHFCHGVEYVCTMSRCPDSSKVFKNQDELRSHLEDLHRVEPRSGMIESVIDKGRRFPLHEKRGMDF